MQTNPRKSRADPVSALIRIVSRCLGHTDTGGSSRFRASWDPVITPADFVTIGLLVALEGLLSADNAMVLAVLVLGLPKQEQRQALRYGIIGAFAFRAVATLAAAYLIQLGWVK